MKHQESELFGIVFYYYFWYRIQCLNWEENSVDIVPEIFKIFFDLYIYSNGTFSRSNESLFFIFVFSIWSWWNIFSSYNGTTECIQIWVISSGLSYELLKLAEMKNLLFFSSESEAYHIGISFFFTHVSYNIHFMI